MIQKLLTKNTSIITLTLLLLLPLTVNAETQTPRQLVESTANQLKHQLEDPAFAAHFNRVCNYVGTLIDHYTDFELISSLVLGPLWNQTSQDDRQRFERVFRLLLIRTYARSFTEVQNWSIRYLPGVSSEKPDRTILKTQILQTGKPPIELDYRMLLKEDGWKIYDLIIEGVSLVTNYRSQFKSQMEKHRSIQQLIKDIDTRNREAGCN